MPRPRNKSKVQIPPRTKGFIPLGYYIHEVETIQLYIEEYEAIRLLDNEKLSQTEASELMGVSRPTLTRIYERARSKIASALTGPYKISIEGGNALFNGEWYTCKGCNSHFNNPLHVKIEQCPLCSFKDIIRQ